MNQTADTAQEPKTGGKLQKATVGDIALSVIIPGWGVLIGLIALIKREFKRGLTMIGIGAVMIAIYVALSSRP
ncbi:MAG TPA: hypothetical protein VF651_04445 [Gammaproteobacteria bacterium]